jgi:hypothetical protein
MIAAPTWPALVWVWGLGVWVGKITLTLPQGLPQQTSLVSPSHPRGLRWFRFEVWV